MPQTESARQTFSLEPHQQAGSESRPAFVPAGRRVVPAHTPYPMSRLSLLTHLVYPVPFPTLPALTIAFLLSCRLQSERRYNHESLLLTGGLMLQLRIILLKELKILNLHL